MKAKFALLILLLGATTPLIAASRVDTSQLPDPVKKSLAAANHGDEVIKITLVNVDGRTVYDIELERKNALNPKLRIAADGEVLRDTGATRSGDIPVVDPEFGTPVAVPTVALSELPAAAQDTIRKEAAGRELGSIKPDTVDGRKAYAVEFKESGWNPRAYVAEDGTLLRPTEKPPTFLIGTRFSDTPPAVQQTVKSQVGSGEIVKIDKDRRSGSDGAVYKIDIKDSRGTYQLQIAEDGRVLENTRPGAPALPSRG